MLLYNTAMNAKLHFEKALSKVGSAEILRLLQGFFNFFWLLFKCSLFRILFFL